MPDAEEPRSLRIMRLARELAASGDYDNAIEIEAEMLRQGCSDATTLLGDGTIQLELNELCARARKSRPAG